MKDKYFRYTAPLYIREGSLDEDALLRIASDKNHPGEDEVTEMKKDLSYLESHGYISIAKPRPPRRATTVMLTERGKKATAAIGSGVRDQLFDEALVRLARERQEDTKIDQ